MPNAPQGIHPIRLLPGKNIRDGIQYYVDKHGIKACYIINCVGSLIDLNLRFTNQEGGSRAPATSQ